MKKINLGVLFCMIVFNSNSLWACLEIPKNLSLTNTSYEKSVEVEFKSNCENMFILSDSKGKRYIERKRNESVCVTNVLYKKDGSLDHENKKQFCTFKSKQILPGRIQALQLYDKKGKVVGRIEIPGLKATTFKILSVDKKGEVDMSLPHFSIKTKESGDWAISAKDNQDEEVGFFDAKARGCFRNIVAPPTGSLDLRGKNVSVGGYGCGSSLSSVKYQGAKKKAPARTKAVFSVK